MSDLFFSLGFVKILGKNAPLISVFCFQLFAFPKRGSPSVPFSWFQIPAE